MDWEAIGASAEAVGAIAVLMTLVYLAIQTRDNVRIQKAQAIWDAQQSFVEVNELLGDGGLVSNLVYRAAAGETEFSEYEQYLLHRFVRGWFQRLEAQYALYQAGVLDEEVWQLRRGYAKAILGNPTLRASWDLDKNNSMFTVSFIESIETGDARPIPGFSGIGDGLFRGD
jgi:hypothetical protein